jgi:hypothetical protein
MHGIRIEFEWVLFSDYRVEVSPGGTHWMGSESSLRYLVASGPSQAALKTSPLSKPDLYLDLAKSEPTEAGHVKFAKIHGLLTDEQRDSMHQWPELVQNMKNLIELVTHKENFEIRDGEYVPYDLSNLRFTLRFSPTTSGAALSIVPTNLYQALLLQCVFSRAGGADIRPCKACGNLFEVGGASGHRSHREFCSDKCRFDFSHRNRRKKQ